MKNIKNDIMIRSSKYNSTTSHDLIDINMMGGLIGVYNRGLSDMYDYLNQDSEKLKKELINDKLLLD